MLRGLQSLLLTAKRREKKKNIRFFNNILMLPDHEISFYCLPFPSIFNLQLPFPQDIKICTFFFHSKKEEEEKRPYCSQSFSHFQFCFFICGAVGGNYVLEWHSLNFVKHSPFIMLIGRI